MFMGSETPPLLVENLTSDSVVEISTNKETEHETVTDDEKNRPIDMSHPKIDTILGQSSNTIKPVQIQKKVELSESVSTDESDREPLPHSELYTLASGFVVNLFCDMGDDEVAIATGVIIHEAGYILTNAHVAPAENIGTCVIRQGSPAHNVALAERIFTPTAISATSSTRDILRRDVAIWKITRIIPGELKTPVPFLAIPSSYVVTDTQKLSTFSYPAELLGSQTIVNALYLSFSETTVVSHDAYFIESTQGLSSQKGSSGGILVDPYTGRFAGLIFAINSKKGQSVSERTLFSLTPLAIEEAIREATKKSLQEYLAEKP